MEAVKGSQLDRYGYPLSGLPGEPPGVRAPLQLHHRCLGQHSPVHSSAVVGDPWRPNSHLLTPAPPPLPSPTRRGGERCHPQGPASSEVTRAQQAHWELCSIECSWGREVLSTPQDLPPTGTLPAGLALCAPLPSGSVKEHLRPHAQCTPLGLSRGLEEAAGHPTHRLPQQPRGRAHMPRCWGPEHRADATPHTRQPRPAGERQRCAPLNAPPPPPGPPWTNRAWSSWARHRPMV